MAAAIGWSLTFCLIWETIQSDNNGSDQNPKAPIHSIQVVVPENDTKSKLDPTYMPTSSKLEIENKRKKANGGGRKSKDATTTGSGSKSKASSGGRRKKQATSTSKT